MKHCFILKDFHYNLQIYKSGRQVIIFLFFGHINNAPFKVFWLLCFSHLKSFKGPVSIRHLPHFLSLLWHRGADRLLKCWRLIAWTLSKHQQRLDGSEMQGPGILRGGKDILGKQNILGWEVMASWKIGNWDPMSRWYPWWVDKTSRWMNDQTDGGRSAAALCSGGAAPNMGMASITRNSHRCFDEKTSINTSMEKKLPQHWFCTKHRSMRNPHWGWTSNKV